MPINAAINMKTKPGVFLDINTLEPSQRPSKSFTENHTVVSELGSGGNIMSEDLYKIEHIKILRDGDKYVLENKFSFP